MNACVDKLFSKKIPMFIINSETTKERNLCYVASSYKKSSMLAGELLCAICHHTDGKIIVLGGDKEIERHRLFSTGFAAYMQKERPEMDIIEVLEFRNEAKMHRLLSEYVQKFDDVRAMVSTTARGTLFMCESVQSLGLSGKVTTIGSDIYEELLPFLKNKTLSATIYQYPNQQALNGIKVLFNHIALNKTHEKAIELPSSVVLSSNAEFFI